MSKVRSLLVGLSHLLPKDAAARVKWRLMIPNMEASLRNMARLGFAPEAVIDVGAFSGTWASMCRRVFPSSRILMYEPQPSMADRLRALAGELGRTELAPVLLSDESGREVDFYLSKTGSSMYEFEGSAGVEKVTLTTATLDETVAGTPFKKPGLLKLDVQGAELDVLRGGTRTLASADAVVLEASIVEEYKGSPLIHEVIAFMAERGFLLYDVCTVWRNTPSEAMNQADLIFVRRGAPLFDAVHYSKKARQGQ